MNPSMRQAYPRLQLTGVQELRKWPVIWIIKQVITHASRFVARKSEISLPIEGRPIRLGAHIYGDGVDFSVVAGYASKVEVCLLDLDAPYPYERRYELTRGNNGMWNGHVRGVSAGQAYGYRVYGEWAPNRGMVHNPAKLLLDPYAQGIGRQAVRHPALFGFPVGDNYQAVDRSAIDDQDSVLFAPVGVVLDELPSVTSRPSIPWDRTVIYEAHVVGLTKTLPGLPEELRGTYAGVAHPITIHYLKQLGITAIELLPIHAKMSEGFLSDRGLENYWGYSTLSYFAPEASYAMASNRAAGPGAVIAEVRGMVELLHKAGIEVILDVVYNHTAEGGNDGPTLSWRGFDNATYYRHDSARPGVLKDSTGTGNSLDFRRTHVITMVLDSLRYWVEKIGVDGFRFDLAVTQARHGDEFVPHHPLYVAMVTDPVLSTVKLINEPWDLGFNGWRTGQFLPPTADWNDRFRDTMRKYWITDTADILSGGLGSDARDFATRISGSADLFSHGRLPGGRGLFASINFITAHDGFTMYDLVSYNFKHNEANLENNRDGSNDNKSWNHGAEGPASADIEKARRKSVRNLMFMLAVSAGTPMITAGDERLKTQDGNNNAYAQNNEISWIDWSEDPYADDMFATVSFLFHLRATHQVLRPTSFFTGYPRGDDALADVEWFDRHGKVLSDEKWYDPEVRTFVSMRSGGGTDPDALMIVNGNPYTRAVTLPEGRGQEYTLIWDSSWERPRSRTLSFAPGAVVSVDPTSVQLYLANPRKLVSDSNR